MRNATVRVYIHVEDVDAPGYFVDLDVTRTVDAESEIVSPLQFRERLARTALVIAREIVARLYDPTDPVYGTPVVHS